MKPLSRARARTRTRRTDTAGAIQDHRRRTVCAAASGAARLAGVRAGPARGVAAVRAGRRAEVLGVVVHVARAETAQNPGEIRPAAAARPRSRRCGCAGARACRRMCVWASVRVPRVRPWPGALVHRLAERTAPEAADADAGRMVERHAIASAQIHTVRGRSARRTPPCSALRCGFETVASAGGVSVQSKQCS